MKTQGKFLLPAQSGQNIGRKTLVLDLDETLVHSSFEKSENTTFSINVSYQVVANNQKVTIYVIVRPDAQKFLQEMQNYYELVIFTASLKEYANKAIDWLDPQNNCISYRLFREQCTLYHGTLIKDLKKLGRNLKDIIIVDNSADAFSLQKENGYLISSFFNDMEDDELLYLIPFLKELNELDDVREVESWKQKFDELALESLEQHNQQVYSENIQEEDIVDCEETSTSMMQQYQSKPINPSQKIMGDKTNPQLIAKLETPKDKKKQLQIQQPATALQQYANAPPKQLGKFNEELTASQQQEIAKQKKVIGRGRTLAYYELGTIKSWQASKSDNFIALRFQNNRKQLKLKISQLRFAVDSSNLMSPLTKRQYYDRKNEILLVD